MKSWMALLVTLFSWTATASNVDVAPVLKNLRITQVGDQGLILKADANVPGQTSYLIGIAVRLDLGNACTQFVGEDATNAPNGMLTLEAKGAYSPLNENCIALLPEPVETRLTFRVNLTANGFGPAPAAGQAAILLNGRPYNVTVNFVTQQVGVTPLFLQAH
jgi:hypothetical protein